MLIKNDFFFMPRRNWLVSYHVSHISSLAPVTDSVSLLSTRRWAHLCQPMEKHPTDGKSSSSQSSPGASLALVLLSFITLFLSKKCSSGINTDCVNEWPLERIPPWASCRSHGSIHYCAQEVDKETLEHSDARGMYSNSYKNIHKQRASFWIFGTVWSLKTHSQGDTHTHTHSVIFMLFKNMLFFCQSVMNVTGEVLYHPLHSQKRSPVFNEGFKWFLHGKVVDIVSPLCLWLCSPFMLT